MALEPQRPKPKPDALSFRRPGTLELQSEKEEGRVS